ncbi:MAG: transcription antitermination factor NusB [Kiritimatiellae bacterium]|nr:transcription antitermination factor NusB [Kiritimatiellia bacterium]
MANRRHAREWALQLLFQLDAVPAEDLGPVIENFWAMQWRLRQEEDSDGQSDDAQPSPEPSPDGKSAADRVAPRHIRAFTERLVRGVQEHRDEIDERITAYADNWPLHRMGGVDRNVLRIAVFEMFCDEQTPPVVIINEAVDLAKFFSSSESGKFVNGILDRACKDVKRSPRETAGGGRRGRR